MFMTWWVWNSTDLRGGGGRAVVPGGSLCLEAGIVWTGAKHRSPQRLMPTPPNSSSKHIVFWLSEMMLTPAFFFETFSITSHIIGKTVPDFAWFWSFRSSTWWGEDFLISSVPVKEGAVITSLLVGDNYPLVLSEQALPGCGEAVRISSREEKQL